MSEHPDPAKAAATVVGETAIGNMHEQSLVTPAPGRACIAAEATRPGMARPPVRATCSRPIECSADRPMLRPRRGPRQGAL
jgi:hypothetical protein